MKKVGVLVLCIFITASGYFSNLSGATSYPVNKLISYETFTLDTVTVYNPSKRQCDSDPFITASNKKINVDKLRNGTIRWMAMSRDMLKRWGGQFHFGDTVMIQSGDDSIDGHWIIQDTMNKRYKNRGDLLFDERHKSHGLWTNVTITKRKIYTLSKNDRLS